MAAQKAIMPNSHQKEDQPDAASERRLTARVETARSARLKLRSAWCLPLADVRCHANAALPISRLAKSTTLLAASSRLRPSNTSAAAGVSVKLGISGRLRL